jgi:hypothetical protein
VSEGCAVAVLGLLVTGRIDGFQHFGFAVDACCAVVCDGGSALVRFGSTRRKLLQMPEFLTPNATTFGTRFEFYSSVNWCSTTIKRDQFVKNATGNGDLGEALLVTVAPPPPFSCVS